MPQDTRPINQLCDELYRAQQEYEMLAFDEPYSGLRGEPASDRAIDALERRLRVTLPQEYREFLKGQNGWSEFDGEGKLLAIEDHGSAWSQEIIEYWSELWDSEDPNPFARGAIPIMMGEGIENFLVLDIERTNRAGELLFVEYDAMHEEQVYQNFSDFLRAELETIEDMIADEKSGVDDSGSGAK